jgi:hypothetical protein
MKTLIRRTAARISPSPEGTSNEEEVVKAIIVTLLTLSIPLLYPVLIPPVSATDHAVQMTCYGFSPDDISIAQGDRILFWNECPGNSICVRHTSGPCGNWGTSLIPYLSYGVVTFNCTPGTENYEEQCVFFYTGTIHILGTPTPTPTPDPVPTTTTAGTGLLLILMGGCISAALLRRVR